MAILVSLALGAAVAAATHWLLATRLGVDAAAMPDVFWTLVAAPVVLAVLVAVVVSAIARRGTSTAAPAVDVEPPPPPEHGALRLLALLQEEGRLVDFLTESVMPYSDAQIGAATRDIHAGCAKALRRALDLEPVLAAAEDSEVTIEDGFDPAAIRLTGNVSGPPPFRGVLRHAGWRVTSVRLPERAGIDPVIVAPAEVEIT
jgi:hypothetical protein